MTESTTTTHPAEEQGKGKSQDERDKALKQAYQSATGRLRDEHRDRFNAIYAEEAEKRGVKWEPRKTAEEKAEEEFQRLLDQFPHLREQAVASMSAEVAASQESTGEGKARA